VIPLLSGKVLGVALEGGEVEIFPEAARVLVPGGRIAVIRPAPEAESHLRALPFELIASDSRAIVARRF
jgi:hypothetical protein